MNARTRYLFSAALPLVAFVSFVGTGTYIDHKRAEPPTVNHDSDFKVPPVELPPPAPTFEESRVLVIPTITIKSDRRKPAPVKAKVEAIDRKFVNCKPWRPLVMGSGNVQECDLE